jgi:cytochrome c peroxidase
MNRIKIILSILTLLIIVITSCKDLDSPTDVSSYSAIKATFSNSFDLDDLPNYANQAVPSYITKDNTLNNPITDEGAILGRVLFYDKALSVDNTVSCASCHQQRFAFGDSLKASNGVNGTTGRHSMRLVNSRFSNEDNFFWDERANTLEEQTTMPIQDHAEMGFSGENGDPGLADLINKLTGIDYYPELFHLAYGNEEISEVKIQLALAQFIRSIQSYDSKYDAGRVNAPNDGAPFQNFTEGENNGKQLFLTPPQFDQTGNRTGGGAGCAGCHQPPEFDIDPDSRSNGVIGSINGGTDFTVTRSPTLRDVKNLYAELNGPLMHTGSFTSFGGVIGHYSNIAQNSNNLDPRLSPGGNPQKLNLSQNQILFLEMFINSLSGVDVYTNEKWSDPF